jgi:polyisoprenoid-binding protein YceI
MKTLPAWLLWCACLSAQAEPVVYLLDPQYSFVNFEVLHFGTSTLRGRFGPLAGQVELDRALGRGSVSLRIATASVDTGMAFFDERLKQRDLLAVDDYPEARYVSTKFIFDGDQVVGLSGDLRLRGFSQTVELRALRFGCHMHPSQQREVCGGDFEGELRRADFGAGFGVPFVANRVRLLVQVEGIRQ